MSVLEDGNMFLGQPCRSMSQVSGQVQDHRARAGSMRTLLVGVLTVLACDAQPNRDLPAIDAPGTTGEQGSDDSSSDAAQSNPDGTGPTDQPSDALAAGCLLPAQPACESPRLVLASQRAVDGFAAWGCQRFAGDLLLTQAVCTDASPIASLAGLSQMEHVAGELALVGLSEVSNLDGLQALQSVGSLRLADLKVSTLAGLANLEIQKQLVIEDLPDLIDAQALASWRLSGADVVIERLSQLSQMPAMTTKPALGRVILRDLPLAQVDPWLASLSKITSRLEIVHTAFNELQALEGVDLREVSAVHWAQVPVAAAALQLELGATLRELTLIDCPNLQDLNFLGDLELSSPQDDADLTLRGLPQVRALAALVFGQGVRHVKVEQTGLTALSPLPAVIVGSLTVTSNHQLTTITGPVELRGARLQVIDQPALIQLAPIAAASQPTAVHLERLPLIADLSAFANIAKWSPETLVVDRLERLQSLAGLATVTGVGTLHSGCDVLCNLETDAIPSESLECAADAKVWRGELRLTDNLQLLSLAGLAQLRRIGGIMAVYGSPSLPPTESCEVMREWRKEAAGSGLLCGPWIDRDQMGEWCDTIEEN